MQSNKSQSNPNHVKGWIPDVYPSETRKFAVWMITENDQRLRLTDSLKPKIYVSGNEESLNRLTSQFPYDRAVFPWDFVHRYARATDTKSLMFWKSS
jgi:hypothetical protein